MIQIEDLLGRLQRVKRTSRDQWVARCPAHDDREPSLAIRFADDRILLYCHAGCGIEAILAALGITFADVLPDRATDHFRPRMPWSPNTIVRVMVQEALCAAVIVDRVVDGGRVGLEEKNDLWRHTRALMEAANHVRRS